MSQLGEYPANGVGRLNVLNSSVTPAQQQALESSGNLETDGSVSQQVRVYSGQVLSTTDTNGGNVATGTVQPTGGVGALGLLSGLWNSIGSLITGYSIPAGGAGILGLLSSIASSLSSGIVANITGKTGAPSVVPAITAGTYTAGKVVGGVMTFANAFGVADSGLLQNITITSKSNQQSPNLGSFFVHIFSANPAAGTYTDGSAPAIGAADVPLLNGVYSLNSPYSGLGTHTFWKTSINSRIKASGSSLYVVLTSNSSMTFASTSDLTVTLDIAQD